MALAKPTKGANQLRIVAGKWRSRVVHFPDAPGLRPTPERVRETLFNWLQGELMDARVLDVFAGSGALSFEALSRGAGFVRAYEKNTQVAKALRQSAQILQAQNFELVCGDALESIAQGHREAPFEVIFLDPPFSQAEYAQLVSQLEKSGWVAPRAWIYTERPCDFVLETLADGWRLYREKQAGQVIYSLWLKEETCE
jgi:16S rRNA (guanine966-N2)-methyltransferase